MSSESRQKNYKHRALDSEELRKRREDLNITLRKQKREDQVGRQARSIDSSSSASSSISNDAI